ncbi:MAG: signal recognition particle-docking protein FtsY [Alkalinema sp. RL_2_19]|nr:signal recognition particle-docking protein FtsY [Alkalinema sp. RL_2_19]
MTFNWFNRPNQPDPNATPADTATPAPESADAATTESASGPSSEELLNYAKLAYENLKKKEASEAGDTPDVSAATTAIDPETDSPSDLDQAAVTINQPVESATASAASPEFASPESESTEPAKIYAPPPDDSALPFWARADADREVRLARLRETAVEVPPPPVAPEPNPTATMAEALPSSESEPLAPAEPVILDGDFVWSAEVLAMQGRRPEDISIEEITWLKQLRQGLDRTRRSLVNNLRLIVGQGPLNEAGVMEIESLLLQADVGIEATDRIIAALQAKLREEVLPPDEAIAYLKLILRELLEEPLQGRHRVAFTPTRDHLNIWLITGVNGAGKTTTIGKLAHIATKSDYRCLIAAADTFRAAAVEQVKVWGQRSNVDVIANPGQNTDPASVVFDAISAAQSRNTELLLVDTAGRLQNKKNLMAELSKIRRIIDKKTDGANVESLLVLDATLGQNGLQQAKVFAEAAQLSGVVLTKLDGTAKGGIALAVVQQLGLPIRFIGAGEGIEDLRPFSSYEFVEALVSG